MVYVFQNILIPKFMPAIPDIFDVIPNSGVPLNPTCAKIMWSIFVTT